MSNAPAPRRADPDMAIAAVERLVQHLKAGALRMMHELLLARLRLEAWWASAGKSSRPPRIVATACWTFPIYSQTFVQEEVHALAQAGFALRFFYAQLGGRAELTHTCGELWRLKRRVLLYRATGALDLAHYRRRMPERVAAVTRLIAAAASLPAAEVERNEHFLHAFSFARAVEAWGADYLHSYFFYEQTLFALVASQLLGIPRGVSCYADHLLQDYPLKAVPLHLQTCDVIVATSHRIRAELETLRGTSLPQVVVKPNAIATSSFRVKRRQRPAAGDPLRLLCVCRIDPKKGIEHLIAAVRILLDRGLAVDARIVGAPDSHSPASLAYAGALRTQVAQLRLDAAVHFAGQHGSREVRSFVEQADIFVAPSIDLANGDKDGIPTAVLEAMAAGCVIVATDAGSIGEAVRDRREGLIVPQRDAGAIAAAVQLLASDESLAAVLSAGAAARSRREYDIVTSELTFHDMIRAAIAARRGATAETAACR